MDAIAQLIPLLIWSAISLIPSIAICDRIGKSRWNALICILPFAGPLIFLFMIAYAKWEVRWTR